MQQTSHSPAKKTDTRPHATKERGISNRAISDQPSDPLHASSEKMATESRKSSPKLMHTSSVSETLLDQLPPDFKKTVGLVERELKAVVSDAKTYVTGNPREALLIGASLALGAWTMFKTQPGRKAFGVASVALMPVLKEFLSDKFGTHASKDTV